MRQYIEGSLIVLCILGCSRILQASPGELDPTFGDGGRVLVDFVGPDDDYALGGMVQPDGKIILKGVSEARGDRLDRKPAIIRLLPDGSFDPAFGIGGKILTAGVDNASFQSIVFQPDGKILAAGSTDYDSLLARFDSDGNLDTSFGDGGTVTLHLDGHNYFSDIAVQPDGKIVVAGNSGFYDEGCCVWSFVVARYSPDGILDPTFGSNGTVEAFGCGYEDTAKTLKIQNDGKIIVAGSTDCIDGGIGLIRLNSNGTFDASFNGNGQVLTHLGDYAAVSGSAVQTDGKIIIASTVYGAKHQFALTRYNSDGSLDLGFGKAGVARRRVNHWSRAGDIALQPDGKIIQAGTWQRRTGDATRFLVLRYRANGSPDRTFVSSGLVKTKFAGLDAAAAAVFLTPDGNILAVGKARGKYQSDFAVAQYDAGGRLNSRFGTRGKVTAGFDDSGSQAVSGIVVQPDGKIVAAGADKDGPRITRHLPDGSLDPAFGLGGSAWNPLGADNATPGIAIAADGKIIVAGYVVVDQSSYAYVGRYDADGAVDSSFGSSGFTLVQLADYPFAPFIAVSVAADGKIVAAGYVWSGSLVAARFNTDGTLDDSFGDHGIARTILDLGNLYDSAFAIQPDGKILLAGGGYDWGINRYEIVVLRYNADGKPDSAFGNGGIVLTNTVGADLSAGAMEIQGDGRILVAGQKYENGVGNFLVVRYLSDGTLDPSFGSGGMVETDFNGGDDYAQDVAIHSDGKIAVAGSAQIGNQMQFGVAQLNPDGSLDLSFGTSGKTMTDFGSDSSGADSIAIQPDDKIIVGGWAYQDATFYDFAIARYKAQ